MQLIDQWDLPFKLESEANKWSHWSIPRRLHQMQVKHLIVARANSDKKIDLPITVEITRIHSRQLDYDNYVHACKYIRDKIAEMLIPGKAKGQADADKRITWDYRQEKGKPSSVRIRFLRKLDHTDGMRFHIDSNKICHFEDGTSVDMKQFAA